MVCAAAPSLSQIRASRMCSTPTLDLRIADPNGQISVKEPGDALPYEQLPRG